MSCEHCRAIGGKLRLFACAVVLVAGTVLITNTVVSDDKTPPDKEMTEDEKKMDEMWAEAAKYANPGEHHAYLKPLAGTWNAVCKLRMSPEAPWQDSNATATSKWILGDRFLVTDWDGEFMGQDFNGFGILGYDIYNKKYQSVWLENMATTIHLSEGTASSNGKVITFTGSRDDPITKTKKQYKSVYRIESKDKFIFEMYEFGDDGKEFKNFVVVQTRKS